jgi:hypothetical protein
MQSLREATDHRILVPTEKEPRYRGLVAAAKRHGRIPDGMQVSIEYTRHDNNYFVAVTLEPLPEWQTKLLAPVPVTEKLAEPSDVVRACMDLEEFSVDGKPRERAFRLLDALVNGARESGVAVSLESNSRAAHRRNPAWHSHENEIRFTIGPDDFWLSFTQAIFQRPHGPTERELKRARQGYMFPDFDDVPDEHLGIVLSGAGRRFWADKWKDTDEHRLEDDLAQILEEIKLRHGYLEAQRAAEAEQRRRAQLDRIEREKRLAEARKRAAFAYREHLIDEEALSQANRWAEAGRLRAYAAEVRRSAAQLPAENRTQALAWAERIIEVANATDPFPDCAVCPTAFAEPSVSDLQPFMNR